MTDDREALASAFMADVLDSFEKLEVLVRLPAPGGAIALPALHEATALAAPAFTEALEGLVRDRVVVVGEGTVQLADDRWVSHWAAVVALHGEDRIRVATMMARASMQRLRAKTARAFADAFIVGSRKGGRHG